jgi:hypothetical protein
MKSYDVLAISPITGRETTFREVSACKLRQNDPDAKDEVYFVNRESGEILFIYNHHFDSVEVITATLVPEERLRSLVKEYPDL